MAVVGLPGEHGRPRHDGRMLKREVCGADARGAFDRSDFGLVVGKDYGFDTEVRLQIQVDAIQAQ